VLIFSPSSFSCGPLQSAFEYDSLNPNSTSYSFCPLLDSKFVSPCSQCLHQTGTEHYLANFITALDAACIQQPVLGKTLSLSGTLFSSTVVNITNPSASPTSTFTPSTGLTLGAKIGIVVAGLIVLLVITGFCIIWRGKRRRRRVLAEKARASGYEWEARHGALNQGPVMVCSLPISHLAFSTARNRTRVSSID
jgi:hypothetical protein